MKNKSGISAVVATVLIILITVAAVTIIWTAVIPMIKNQASFEQGVVNLDIETTGGYTLCDKEKDVVCVQIGRESDGELEGMKIIFNVNGNSLIKVLKKEDVPELNQKKVFCFDLMGSNCPESVSVVGLPEGIPSKVTIKSRTLVELPSELLYWDVDCEERVGGFYSGSGTVEDPFLVCNCEMLQKIKDNLTLSYSLISGIDCSETREWNGGRDLFLLGVLPFLLRAYLMGI